MKTTEEKLIERISQSLKNLSEEGLIVHWIGDNPYMQREGDLNSKNYFNTTQIGVEIHKFLPKKGIKIVYLTSLGSHKYYFIDVGNLADKMALRDCYIRCTMRKDGSCCEYVMSTTIEDYVLATVGQEQKS